MRRYALSFLVAVVVIAIKLLFADLLGSNVPYLLLSVAVLASALYGGMGPGLVTSALVTAATSALFISPSVGRVEDVVIPSLLFFAEAVGISWLCQWRLRLEGQLRREEIERARAETRADELGQRNEERQQTIVQMQRSQRAIEAANRQLAQKNRDLESFALIASHDLQEPLRKIRAFGDRLVRRYGNNLEGDGQLYIERMQDAAIRMQQLIEDLLTLSRIATRGRPFQKKVDIAREVRMVLSDLEARISESNAVVEVSPLPTIEGDATQIRQLFTNLIGNALKFRREGVRPQVRISAEQLDGLSHEEAEEGLSGPVVRIEVVDNGIGFDEKYLGRIFTIFQRLHGRNQYEGTGIGLSICQRIVERHHGTITARSRPGEGAAFIVTLPVTQNGEH